MSITVTASTWDFSQSGEQFLQARRAISAVYELGFQPELWLHWNGDEHCYDRANWPALRQIVKPSPALSFHTRNDRARMFEEIEMLAYLGGRAVVVHPIVVSLAGHEHERPEMHPDIPFIRELAAAARQHGVFLALENIFSRGFQDRTLESVDTFDQRGGLGICIDLGHTAVSAAGLSHAGDVPDSREGATELIRDFAPALLHLHVHDVVGAKDHQPLGTGTMDYTAIAAALRAANFNGTACLEHYADAAGQTVLKSWEILKSLFGDEVKR